MKQAKGKFCGGFKPPKTPFHATPVLRPYSRSRRRQGRRLATIRRPAAPARRAELPGGDEQSRTTPAPDDAADNGGNGTGGFDPDKYESPPQPSPDTKSPEDDGAGGTQAPG